VPLAAVELVGQLGSVPDKDKVDRAVQAEYTVADSGLVAFDLAGDIRELQDELDMGCSPSAADRLLDRDIVLLAADQAVDRDIAHTAALDADRVDFVEHRESDDGKDREADTVLADWVAEDRTLGLDIPVDRRAGDLAVDSLKELDFSLRFHKLEIVGLTWIVRIWSLLIGLWWRRVLLLLLLRTAGLLRLLRRWIRSSWCRRCVV
jgi:hypothetical protein